MNQQNPRRVAVWLDQRIAILVAFEGECLEAEEEIVSEAGPHTHGGGWSQHRIEAHRHELLKHFYEEIVDHLGAVDEILIVGPGQAKHDLRKHIEHHKGLKGKVVELETVDKMTEKELVARAESFFDLTVETKA